MKSMDKISTGIASVRHSGLRLVYWGVWFWAS